VFHANPNGRDQLYQMNVATRTVTPIAASAGNNTAPAFSPDGRFIAFNSDREAGWSDLYVFDIARDLATRLTFRMRVRSQPSWSSDGKRILFSALETGADEVYFVNADGSGLRRLTRGTEGTR
jgi:TolB protein